MSAVLPIMGVAALAAAAALKASPPKGSRSTGLRLGANDLGWVYLDLDLPRAEYPDISPRYEDHLVLCMIDTYERGRFFEAMALVERFAQEERLSGVMLHAVAFSPIRINQEALERLYRRAGYREMSTDEVGEGYDEDSFFVKTF
jgi:hypothetical protein